MAHVFRVSEMARALKDVIEGQFPFVWVRGQVSNLSRPASGHVYFSLKDEEAVLNVVWFKGSQNGLSLNGAERYDPLTGEVLPAGDATAWLADGVEALCAGRLTLYPPRGACQLVAELVQDMGQGRLHLEFEALKRRLAALGWFDPARKRPMPPHPERVAVVTAPTGAAIRDFLRVASTRGWGADIRVHPVQVQGEAAPAQIAEALARAGSDGWAQVVALIRGGGSVEDLGAFNTEQVAGAVVQCPVPVICGVGHEVDVTIADLAADLRAATPSHAAQLLWPERSVLAQRADEAEMRLTRAFHRFIESRSRLLDGYAKALSWLSPRSRVERLADRLEGLALRLEASGRGRVERAGQRLENLSARLAPASARLAERASSRLEVLSARLEGLDPERPLARGYALARKADGTFLRSVDEVRPGDGLDILVRDGAVNATVSGVERGRG